MAKKRGAGKKRGGIGSSIWKALVWAAHGAFRIVSFVAVRLLSALAWVAGRALQLGIRMARKAGDGAAANAAQSRRPHNLPSEMPLTLQKHESGKLGDFEERLYSSKSTIGIVLGARGSGKSALGMRLLENAAARTGRQVCAMGFDALSLPSYITCVNAVEEVPNNAFVLVDEGGILFSSRESMSAANKILSSLLLIARHKDLSVLFISQNSANLELNAIRQADFLLLRKPSLLQQEFERKKIGKIYEEVAPGFVALAGQGKYSTYVYSDEFRGFVSNGLPTFWSAKASKMFADFKTDAGGT